MAKHKTKDENPENNKWANIASQEEETDTDEGSSDSESTSSQPQSEEPTIDPKAADALQNRIQRLEEQIVASEEKAARVQAEMENVRRRTDRNVTQAHRFGNEKIISELLPVVDSLQRGLESMKSDDPTLKSMHDGFALTLDLLEKTLLKFGLDQIIPDAGEAFNPDLHEAMSMQPSTDFTSNTVIQCFQKGYQLNGRVIRAAMVVVAK